MGTKLGKWGQVIHENNSPLDTWRALPESCSTCTGAYESRAPAKELQDQVECWFLHIVLLGIPCLNHVFVGRKISQCWTILEIAQTLRKCIFLYKRTQAEKALWIHHLPQEHKYVIWWYVSVDKRREVILNFSFLPPIFEVIAVVYIVINIVIFEEIP